MAAPELPPPGFFSNFTSPIPSSEGPVGASARWDAISAFIRTMIGGAVGGTVTLSGDTFTPDKGSYVVAAQSGTADDLKQLGVTEAYDGMIVELAPDVGDTITVWHNTGGAGKIVLADAANLVLSDPTQRLWLVYSATATSWIEDDRAYGGSSAGKSAFRAFLGLVIGGTVQAYSATLTTLAGAITSAGQAMAAAADAAAQRALLGLGTAAELDTGTTADKVVKLDGSGRLPAVDGSQLTNLNAGKIVNRYFAEYTANANLATNMSAGNVVPAISDGTEVASLAVVTTTTTQRVRVRFSGFGSVAATGNYLIAALFQGTSCINATMSRQFDQNEPAGLAVEAEVLIGAATTTTFSVRCGTAGGVGRLNGSTGARIFGGAARATLVAEVIEP